uniref:Peroxiredoxin-6 n=1 Tax=Ciona savignyi TaxID=51511 RepID=H2YWX8_CIOSA
MPVNLGQVFPDFDCVTTQGNFKLLSYLAGSWGILFSHPADFTPVCTTELGMAAAMKPEFDKRQVKMLGLSIDSVKSHNDWMKVDYNSSSITIYRHCLNLVILQDIQSYSKLEGAFPYPIIAGDRKLALDLGMLDPDELDATGMPLTARCVFIIGPDQKLKLSLLYPATTGRNFNEIIRVIDSLQLTANKKVATPANWKSGEKCMVIPSLSDAQAKDLFPKGFETTQVPSGKCYIRLTPDP